MNIQSKYIQKFKIEKTFVDIYSDIFEESIYGYVLDFNEEFILLEQYTDIGKADGIVILKRENITRIRWNGNEINTASNFAIKENRTNASQITIDNINIILNSVQNVFGYVNISIQNVDNGICMIGQIEEIDDEFIVLKEYGTYVSLDRKNLILSINEITKVEAGGSYEQNLHELFNNSN